MITFREFLIICEKKSSTPPHAVPGTYKEVDGVKTYTLARHDAPPTPLGTEKKVKKELEKQGGIGGGAIKKVKKKAKKIEKIKEDIEKRRQQLKQRQLQQVAAQKQKVSDYQSAQKEKQQAAAERETLKKEIKRELQSEQSPTMEPNLYSKQVAMRQGAQKTAQIKHVHQELGAEARAQQTQKRAEMKAILSR
jgi:hypothetical protein